MERRKAEILYVDDEIANLKSFKASFRTDYNVHIANSAQEGINILKSNPIEVILTDQRMPNKTGIEFLEDIVEKYPHPTRMILTGYTDIETVIDAVNKGKIFNYISKPWEYEQLKETIEEGVKAYQVKSNIQPTKENRYETLFKQSADPIFIADAEGTIIDVNDAAITFFKYSRSELYKIKYTDLIYRDNLHSILKNLYTTGTVKDVELTMLDRKKNKFTTLVNVNKIINDKEEVIGFQATIKDITHQEDSKNTLIKSIVDTHESERKKFARELHESLGQQLAGIRFSLQAMEMDNDPNNEINSEILGKSNEILEGALKELQKICFDLMPSVLTDFGLVEAIQGYCSKIKSSHPEITIDITLHDNYVEIEHSLEVIIFRLVQKFISNAIDLKKATYLKIQINSCENKIELILEDNGEEIKREKKLTHQNIVSIVEAYKGSVKEESHPEKGNKFTIFIPRS